MKSANETTGESLKVIRMAIWAAAFLALISAGFLYFLTKARQADAGVATAEQSSESGLAPAPSFRMTDQTGKPFDSESLKGKVWVVEFFFTRCTGVCPVMNRNMKKVYDALKGFEGFEIVSISVDSNHDTPEVLAEYAKKFGADATKWHFLNGPKEDVVRLSREGFLLGTSEVPEEFVHSNRFVLVGRDGLIRSYYVGTDEADVHQLIADALRLVKEEPAPDGVG
jgi:protein SCO1/2